MSEPLSDGLHELDQLLETPDADPRDLGQTQIRQIRGVFENRQIGLFLFSKIIFGYKDLTTDLHLPLCRFLSRWGETVLDDGTVLRTLPTEDEEPSIAESWRRLIAMIPREHFKTSVCTRALPLWTIARDPSHDPTFGIVNEKEENAKRWVGAIAQVVEASRLFQILWPDMLPPGVSLKDREAGKTKARNLKFGDAGIMFERESIGVPELSIEPHGVGGAMAGKHFTHMILDDIIGKKASESVAVMEDVKRWFDGHRSLERPAEKGCELIACTPWAYNDVYAYGIKKWGDYRVYRRSLLENERGEPDLVNGKSIFPAKISTRQARKMHKTDPFWFNSQYMCTPKAGRHMDFDEAWLRFGQVLPADSEPVFRIGDEHYDPAIMHVDVEQDAPPQFIPLSRMDKCVILDPAPTKPAEMRREPGARNGILAVGQDAWGRRFVFDECPLREDPVQVFHALIAMCMEWGIRKVAIEDVNFSYVYRPLYDQMMKFHYPDIHVDFIPLYTEGRDKDSRIKDLIPSMRTGFWYFNEPCTRYLVQEMLEYPNGETVDLIDALAYTDKATSRSETPYEHYMASYERFRAPDRGVTGYGF